MASMIIHDDWLNENRNRKYPFFDDASLVDTTGTMTLPNELIVDLIFPIHAMDYDVALFHLSRIVVFNGGVIISIGYNGTTIATRAITEAEHTVNKTYYIEGSGSFTDSVGRIAIGPLEEIKKYGGTYNFNVTNGRLLPTVLRPSLKGVSSISVVSADGTQSGLLQGDIELVAGSNIELEVIAGSPRKLRISAVNNPNYEVECDCPDTTQGECVKTINNVIPDVNGNFTLTPSACISITPQTGGLLLDDNCATPCCGCEEIEIIKSELSRLGTQMLGQEAFAERAMGNIDQLTNVILASKIGTVVPC